MDDIKSQIINSISAQTQPQIDSMLNDMQGQLQQYLTIALAMGAVVTLALVINTIYKFRVERAILRIDSNLKKLLEQQTGEKKTDTPIERAPVAPSE